VIDEVPATDLLPLVFTTALVLYVLAMGSVDLARSIIRIAALLCVAFCLAVWAAAGLNYATWGAGVIEEFYATAILFRYLGAPAAGGLLALLAIIALALALRDFRRFRLARLRDQ
jgi:nitroreductase